MNKEMEVIDLVLGNPSLWNDYKILIEKARWHLLKARRNVGMAMGTGKEWTVNDEQAKGEQTTVDGLYESFLKEHAPQ